MQAVGVGFSDIGRHRATNEDALFIDDELGLYMVSDGMGGHAGGEIAAQLAIATAARHIWHRRTAIEQIRNGERPENQLSHLAATAVSEASSAVLRMARENRKLKGMGCTLTILLLGRHSAFMAHVGDSRLYLERDGTVRQLSTDHNVAQELLMMGVIMPEEVPHLWGGRALTEAVGVKERVRMEELAIELEPDDRFILCSDGLSDYLEEPHQLSVLLADEELEFSAEKLVAFANDSGGRDNISAIVVDIGHEIQAMPVFKHTVTTRLEYPGRAPRNSMTRPA
ncbi:MAG: protein phosphatase 2C domain-containing protein [Proteobacteria bacterium]|nr:protein phosphatase 2C domain-containing protein [Pseudomonadota bacterium]